MTTYARSEYLTPTMVAKDYPTMSVRWLERQRWERKLPIFSRAGRRICYERKDIEAFLTDNKVVGGQR